MELAEFLKLVVAGSPSVVLAFGWFREWKRNDTIEKAYEEFRKRHDDFIEELLKAQMEEKNEKN